MTDGVSISDVTIGEGPQSAITTGTEVVFITSHSFWWPVTVQMPGDGAHHAIEFEAKFKLATDDALFPNGDAAGGDEIARERALLTEHVLEVRGITGGTLEEMLAYAPYRLGLYRALAEAHTGRSLREGN
ncbi:MAG: hypothetical protein AAGC57_20240 [Pseudomonadota bacterium]